MKILKYALITLGLFSLSNVSAQEYKISADKSELKWHGKKVSGEHYGTIKLKNGSFTLKDNKIVSGKFEIDMSTINNEDLTSPEWNKKLVDHLKSDDFFGVADYPVSTLVITGSTPFVNGTATVNGNLTIKGTTHPVEFKADKEGKTYSAKIVIDRTKYDVRYGSGKFFDNLGDNMIYDDFTMDVMIVAQ